MAGFFKKLLPGSNERKCGSSRTSNNNNQRIGCIRQFSTLHTTILSTEDQQNFARRLSRAMKESGIVIIDNKLTVMEKCGKNHQPKNQSKVLLEYIKGKYPDGIIVLSSLNLTRCLNDDCQGNLQVDGVSVQLDWPMFKKGIDEQFCKKVILLSLSEREMNVPHCFTDTDKLILTEQAMDVEVSRLTTDRLQAALKKKSETGLY